MKKINFFNADIVLQLKNKKHLKSFLCRIMEFEKKDFDTINYIFCTDEYLLNINRQFLDHDFYTDIITFYSSKQFELLQSEIYISLERIKENAKSYSVSYENELLRVLIHGILHLCNYDDKIESDKLLMRSKENEYLEKYFNVSREI